MKYYLVEIYFIVAFFYCSNRQTEAQTCMNCLIGESHCEKHTGSCLYGCKPGWTGKQCVERCSIDNCVECYTYHNNTEVCDKCEYGFYGDKCQNKCNDKCIMGRCNTFGDCVFGCKTYWSGLKCDQQVCSFDHCLECGFSSVYYIPICAKCEVGMFYSYEMNRCVNCSSRCIGGQLQCNTSTGVCLQGCEKGFYGTNCDRKCTIDNCEQCVLAFTHGDTPKCRLCSQGFYPLNVVCVDCSSHCVGGQTKCNSTTGHCLDGCEFGWFGERCDKKCQIPQCQKCVESRSGNMYCELCNEGMYFDENSLGGSCRFCSNNCEGGKAECDPHTGKCLNGCAPGYHGDKCNYVCGNCIGGTCYVNGTCINGCEAGWYTEYCTQTYPEHCSDGSQFLKNGTCGDCQAYWYGTVCDKKCSSSCRPSNYNGYIYCDKYSGKCDSGCLPGFYGETCTLKCNENCNYGNCDQTTGACLNGCEYKYYGRYCEKRCPVNCQNPGCDMYSGECMGECTKGFYGTTCDQKCNTGCKNETCHKLHGACAEGCTMGYFGNTCNRNCSQNCLNSTCDPFNGRCSGCNQGYYGTYCQFPCNGCVNSTCIQDSAFCLHGCLDGYSGSKCEDRCPQGTYGTGCKSHCYMCRNTACNPETGECYSGCAVGFTGKNCEDQVPLDSSSLRGEEKDTIAIATSVSVSVVLTIAFIVIVFIVVCRKKNIGICSKMKKSHNVDNSRPEMQTIPADEPVPQNQAMIDPADLQLYPVIVSGQRFEIKFGKYCNSFRSSPVMVRILPTGSSETDVKYFYRDVDILRDLPKQKNIVYFLGIGSNKGSSFSVFELCGSGVLQVYLRHMAESNRDHTGTILKKNLPELMSICLGVITGMEYLAHKKILHRHIATVNVFIDETKRSKIGNFFYAVNSDPEMYEIEDSKLPEECVPWLAPESVQDRKFSCQSEIYSYGVFLWEVMSLGEDVLVVKSKLLDSESLPKPDGCDSDIYKLMLRCWSNNPLQRPTLKYLYENIADCSGSLQDIDQISIDDSGNIRYTTV